MNFEEFIAGKINQHEVEPSPKVMEQLFAKRTKGYLLMNHIRLNKYAYSIGVILLSVVISAVILNKEGNLNQNNNNQSAINTPLVTSQSENKIIEDKIQLQNENEEKSVQTNNKTVTEQDNIKVKPVKSVSQKTKEINNISKSGINKTNNQNKNVVSVNAEKSNKTQNSASQVVVKKGFVQDYVPAEITSIARLKLDRQIESNIMRVFHNIEDGKYIKRSFEDDRIAQSIFFSYLIYKPMKKMPSGPYALNMSEVKNAVKPPKGNGSSYKATFLDLYYLPSFYSAINPATLQESVSLKTNFTSAIGLRISCPLYKGLLIQAGLSNTTFKTDFSYQPAQADRMRTDSSKQYINNPGGPVIVKTTYDTTRYRIKDFYGVNKMQQFSLPVGLSYMFDVSDKVKIFANAGGILNIISKGKGNRFDASSETEVSPYKNNVSGNVSLGYYFGGTLSYSVAPKWNLLVEPTFKMSGTKGMNGISGIQKYYLIGSSFGLRYTW